MDFARIPENLNLTEIVKGNPTKMPGFKMDKVYVVCELIYLASLKLHDVTFKHPQKTKRWYVPLHNKILEHYLGSRTCKPMLLWMQTSGIIDCDESYENQIVSTGYRFSKSYRNSMYVFQKIEDFVLSQKKRYQYKSNQSKTVRQLTKWYDKLTIDYNEALAVVNTIYQKEVSAAAAKANKKKREKLIAVANQRRRCNQIILDIFKTRDFPHTVDKHGKRLHTVITRLPKYLRPYVKYDGKDLVQVDISNSFLYFAIVLHWRSTWMRNKNTSYFWDGLILPKSPISLYNSIMSCNTSESQTCIEESQEEFRKLASRGEFYSYFVDKLSEEKWFHPSESIRDRIKRVKTLLLAQVNANSQPHDIVDFSNPNLGNFVNHTKVYDGRNESLWELFKNEFPVMAQVFHDLKAWDYKNVAYLLQRIESYGIIEVVCRKILSHLKSTPIFSLHDCIVTTKEHAFWVRKIIYDQLELFVGLVPTVETTMWAKYKADIL
jgi:hypothetical protein